MANAWGSPVRAALVVPMERDETSDGVGGAASVEDKWAAWGIFPSTGPRACASSRPACRSGEVQPAPVFHSAIQGNFHSDADARSVSRPVLWAQPRVVRGLRRGLVTPRS